MSLKSECIAILRDIKNEMEYWDWNEDYYGAGFNDKYELMNWAQDRIDIIIDLVEKCDE